MARNRLLSIANGTDTNMVISSITITGDSRFTLPAFTLPLTITQGDVYGLLCPFDDSSASGTHSATVTVIGTSNGVEYTESSVLSSVEEIDNNPIISGYDIIVMFGQSNGYSGSTRSDILDIGDPEIFQLSRGLSITTGGYTVGSDLDIVPALDPLQHHDIRNDKNGHIMQFCHDYKADGRLAEGRELLIIPCNQGATDMDVWVKGTSLYQDVIDRTLHAMNIQGSKLVAMVMHQGESDAENGKKATYESKKRGMIRDMRNDLNTANPSIPYATPFLVGGLPPDWTDWFLHTDMDTYNQNLIITETQSAYYDGRLPTRLGGDTGNDIHYNAESQRELGKRAYLALATAEGNNVPFNVPSAISDLSSVSNIDGEELTWSEPNDGQSKITRYIVEYKLSSEPTTWTTYYDKQYYNHINIVGLTIGVSYDFRVTAVNNVGIGATSNISTSTPVAVADPYTYSNITNMFIYQPNVPVGITANGTYDSNDSFNNVIHSAVDGSSNTHPRLDTTSSNQPFAFAIGDKFRIKYTVNSISGQDVYIENTFGFSALGGNEEASSYTPVGTKHTFVFELTLAFAYNKSNLILMLNSELMGGEIESNFNIESLSIGTVIA